MSLKLRRYCECHILYNYRVWVVETIWTKLAAPHTVIETSLRNSSQELNFLLRRPGGETSPFGSIAGAETALTREFGRHVFEIALRVIADTRFDLPQARIPPSAESGNWKLGARKPPGAGRRGNFRALARV